MHWMLPNAQLLQLMASFGLSTTGQRLLQMCLSAQTGDTAFVHAMLF